MNKYEHGAIIPLAGGFSLGAMNMFNSPPKIIFSYKPFYENDKLLLNYLKSRGYDIPYIQLDNLSENEIAEITKNHKNLDFVHGIPPCSGLSQAAQRKAGTRSTAAPNDWMYTSAQFVLEHISPTIYAFENAPGLYTNMGKEVRENLISIGKRFGYSITFYKTNTLKHGIPQNRPRTFAFFYKGPYAPMLNYYNKPRLNFKEYLKLIPSDAKHQNEYATKDWDISKYEITRYLKELHGENWKEVITNFREHITSYDYLFRIGKYEDFMEWHKNLPDEEKCPTVAKNILHIKKNHDEGRNARISYRVLGLDKDYPYAVIGEMMLREVHPEEDRLLNIREHMHLMGIPHDYEIENPKDYVKITQNVPVCTCENMSQEIIEILNGNRPFYHESVYMQDNTIEKSVQNKNVKLF